jgi:beta-lactamase class A
MSQPKNTPVIKISALVLACLVIGAIGCYKLSSHPAASHATTKNPAPTKTAKTPTSAAKDTPKPVAHTDAQLQQIIDTWAAQHSFAATVDVQELHGSLRTAARAATSQMTTASTYKIYVAYATLHEVEQGTYTMQTSTRTGQTVQAALQKMILQSDNDSAEALGFLVGWDKVNALAKAAGAQATNINNYGSGGSLTNANKVSTAADLTTMITKLQQGTLLNSADTQLLLGLMKTQVWRERIPAGVPSGISVADKPGWLDNVENDAGIVYGPKSTYTLVIMTNGSTTQPLADLSRLIYDYLEQ